jgi:hypothetical protein
MAIFPVCGIANKHLGLDRLYIWHVALDKTGIYFYHWAFCDGRGEARYVIEFRLFVRQG